MIVISTFYRNFLFALLVVASANGFAAQVSGSTNLPSRFHLNVRLSPVVDLHGKTKTQALRVEVGFPNQAETDAVIRLVDEPLRSIHLKPGSQTFDFDLPVAEKERVLAVSVVSAGRVLGEAQVPQKPARPLTVYVLPHSHTDIGYTEIQSQVEDKQVNNLLAGIELAKATATNAPGARFVWNVEVLWAADLFLQRLGSAEREQFFDAVKHGQVALNGMYLNELTGLCRPEELIRLFEFATELRRATGQPLDAAMISDVPGYTWGTVPALTQAGIKYFSAAPNYFDRIGDTLVQWENKPFWWIGPDGNSKVLVWIPFWGYAMSHRYHGMSRQMVEDLCAGLEQHNYPYDIAYVRWAGHGDNARPDVTICDFIQKWNAEHASPHFVISSTSEAFQAFEKRYGAQLPSYRGDWTPYWEDGAGSSAAETAMNRATSDRLTQAQALWAMLSPATFPAADFRAAWRNVLLYSEHTWGAWCSVTDPARQETREQWSVKQSYAVTADRQARDLFSRAASQKRESAALDRLEVYNTTSWARSELVTVPNFIAEGKRGVVGPGGEPVPSQRLKNHELVFWAGNIPGLSQKQFCLTTNAPGFALPHPVKVADATLDNGVVRVAIDKNTGGISELRAAGFGENFVDTTAGQNLNDYVYFTGDDSNNIMRSGPVKISVGESGPLVASLIIESDAPGCRQLRREIRLSADADFVEVINLVDKKRIDGKNYRTETSKESVNFAFAFNVPDGEIRYDVPFGVARPELDQIPGACKNWICVNRWVDVANQDFGINWVTVDAPLVEVGGLTANLLNSQTNPDVWRKKIGRTQRLYSWAMNNHWGTNYRAYQEGPVVFRFILRPHRGATDPAENTCFATGFSQPLLVAPARAAEETSSLLQFDSPDVVVAGLKPSEDGRSVIVRVFNASTSPQFTRITLGNSWKADIRLSDTSEANGERITKGLSLPPNGLVTLRLNLK